MATDEVQKLGLCLKKTRIACGLSQAALARTANVARLKLVRAEQGLYPLNLDESIRVARVLKVPLEQLTTGRWGPTSDLRGIAFELYQLGIRDLEVAEAYVPGAFRLPEQVLVVALKGDRPEPRVVEAMPYVLARRQFRVPLVVAVADFHDPRVRTRLAWLSDITMAISRLSDFPLEVKSEKQLRDFVEAGVRDAEADSLGHGDEGERPPLWRRWNITYAAGLTEFRLRMQEIEAAYLHSQTPPESNE